MYPSTTKNLTGIIQCTISSWTTCWNCIVEILIRLVLTCRFLNTTSV